MKYNEGFLLEAAARLESKATWIVYSTATRYGITGAAISCIGIVLVSRFRDIGNPPTSFIVAAATIAALGIGVAVGRSRAFLLRVEEHKLLALVQIERDLHKPTDAHLEAAVSRP